MKARFGLGSWLWLVAIVATLAACGGESAGNAADSGLAITNEPRADDMSDNAASASNGAGDLTIVGTVSPDEPQGQSVSSIPQSFAAMLEEMGDYQLVVSVSFEGSDADDMPIAFEFQSIQTVVREPPSVRLDISVVDGGGQGLIESMSLVSLGYEAYLYLPAVGCVSGSPDEFADFMSLPVDPGQILQGLTAAREVDSGVFINGVKATEFQFDDSNLPWSSSGPWSVSGAIFVEEKNSTMSRVTMSVSGQGDLLDSGRILDGTYDIVIDVTDIAETESVIVPDACRRALPYPVPPDAYDITAIEDLLAFKSLMPLVDIVDFYVSEMPAAGWQLAAEPDVFEELAIMNFEQGDTELMINAEYDVGSGIVSVLISP